MNNKPVALITGANKGIGFQIAKDLVTHGFTVLIGSRSEENGKVAAGNIGADAHAIQLDVTDHQSVYNAAARIQEEFGRLDVLVNNAGIAYMMQPNDNASVEEIMQAGLPSVASVDEVRTIFETNVFGVITVTQAMLPLLRKADVGRIVNISSELGSIEYTLQSKSTFLTYGSSKTALNAITAAFAVELESTSIKVNAVCPGFTATEMNNFKGGDSVEEAAKQPVRLALLGADGPTGTFSNKEGIIPW